MVKGEKKMLGRAITFEALMGVAYDMDPARIVLPSDKPQGAFDLLMTTPDASPKKLQDAIQQQFGYVAHRDSRQTEVLLLSLRQSGAPGLRPHSGANKRGGSMSSVSSSSAGGATASRRTVSLQNVPMSSVIKNLQGYFGKPILDKTGLTGNYDVSMEVVSNGGDSESDAIARALATQLGLDLVSSQEAVEMLVVEKAK